MTNDNSNKQNLPEKDVVLKDVEISNDSVVSENANEKEDLIVEIKGLYKKYAKAADFVIHDINIECRSGEIVGLLGKNGAGKSTTIKCLTGFFPFDKGEIKICGHDIKTEPVKAKMNLGYVPDNRAMFDKMTGTEYINFIADLHKTPVEDRVARIDEMQKSSFSATKSTRLYRRIRTVCAKKSVLWRRSFISLNSGFWTSLSPDSIRRRARRSESICKCTRQKETACSIPRTISTQWKKPATERISSTKVVSLKIS